MKQTFASYEEMPLWLIDYILTVSDAKRITDISLNDINDFLRGLDEYHEQSQNIHSDVGHDWDRVSH